MKFKVSRTSGEALNETQPCKESFFETYNEIQIRNCNSFEEFDKEFGEDEGNWLSEGINHCINKEGYIQREIVNGEEGWFVNINSLEELIEFNKKYGKLILRDCWWNESIKEIEIYDERRE